MALPWPVPSMPDLSSWEGVKGALKLEERLGKWGKMVPMEEIKKGAGKILDKIFPTGPTAEIAEAEKVPPQNPSMDSDFDPVFLHNGEFYTTATDVMLPAAGFDFQFTRIYRSRSSFLGVLGENWTHNFAERLYLRETEGERGITYIDPEGKKYFLRFDVSLNRFLSPPGLFVTVLQNENGFVLRHRNGEEHIFDGEGRLQRIRNDKGQTQHCIYNDSGQLVRVEDSLGRPFHFFYRDGGLLERVEDFTGRVWRFDYNDKTELIAATSPGTPAFPKGKTTRYRYDDAHRMTFVMDSKGQIYLQNFYAASGRDAGKIIAQHYGGDEIITEARYDGLKTWVKDRVGVVHLYEHDSEGHLLQKGIIKPDGGYKMQRRYVYDANGIVAKEIWPSGKVVILTPSLLKGKNPEHVQGDRQYQHDPWGNILSETDADGNVRKFEVDASNLVTKETNDDGERFYFLCRVFLRIVGDRRAVNAAAQKNSHRHVANKMSANRIF